MQSLFRLQLCSVAAILLTLWCLGLFGRDYWTPDEPREADIAWRMSWQPDKAVPLLAGEAFCEKPPLTYWAAAAPIDTWGTAAWVARLPNLLYALITALSIGFLAARALGRSAGLIAAAAISTFLLTYQVAIWLATDAPLLAFVSAALLGLYRGFHSQTSSEKLWGYTLMHAAMAAGFLSKSGVAFMVPVLTLATLIIVERRWRELLRYELYVGILLQAAMILTWVGFVYVEPNGLAHLKTFFWNNLMGRFTRVAAPEQLQYAAAHRNLPGKYLWELPVYVFPWDVLVIAAAARAWRRRREWSSDAPLLRFALATFLPSLVLLSLAATARNVYLAPALPGLALLIAWWGKELITSPHREDLIAVRGSVLLLLLAVAVLAVAVVVTGIDDWQIIESQGMFVVSCLLGFALALQFSRRAWRNASPQALSRLFLAYSALLIGPVAQIYDRVDGWQNLASIAHAVQHESAGGRLALFKPDETTRAVIDMFGRTSAEVVDEQSAASVPGRFVLYLLPGRGPPRTAFIAQLLKYKRPATVIVGSPGMSVVKAYELPNGRRYALLKMRG
jgi:4-amino-4-deoxy-L-arabinose transferase-like glycosyltransferase